MRKSATNLSESLQMANIPVSLNEFDSNSYGKVENRLHLSGDIKEHFQAFPLSEDLVLFFPGNDFVLYSMDNLFAKQAGFALNSNSGEPIPNWKKHWIVLGDHGANPIIYNTKDFKIYCGLHGCGNWQLRELSGRALVSIY
ncbi:MAG: hypothetical protein HRU09_16505 [Oligoflexales bacterium]|nr:hypothetical protein [Oligoflexales bacterium]